MRTESALYEQDMPGRAAQGDTDAMQRLIDSHYPLICSLSSRIRCTYIERDVLIQAGILGFMQAVLRYDPQRGAQLTTYAVPWILGEMKKTLRQEIRSGMVLSLEREQDADGYSLQETLQGCADVDLSAIDLHMAFEKLSQEARLLICLRYFRDKTQKEAAILLKKSQAQISRMERQALEALHEFLA